MPLPGDFGLVSIPGAGGWGVRVGQWLNGDGWSDFHHAFVVLDQGEVLEAEPGGARIVPLVNYAGSNAVYSSWPLTDDQRAAIVGEARPLVGTPYSWLDYLSLALHRLHIPAPHLRAYIASTGHMICSQLTDEVYRRAGLHMFNDGRWPGDITPGDLTAVLSSTSRRATTAMERPRSGRLRSAAWGRRRRRQGMSVGMYRPLVNVEAVQYTGSNWQEVAEFTGAEVQQAPRSPTLRLGSADAIEVALPTGLTSIEPGVWMIKGTTGRFFPMGPDEFEVTYEPMDT